jgi:hypothetical protein
MQELYLLKGIGHQEDSRRKVSDSEVIATSIVAALYFGGHLNHSRHMMKMASLFPEMLDKSRFCRRLHQLEGLLWMLFYQVVQYIKDISGACD